MLNHISRHTQPTPIAFRNQGCMHTTHICVFDDMALFMQDRERDAEGNRNSTYGQAIATTPHCFVGRKWPDLVAGRTTASPFFFFSFGLGYAILIKLRLLPACCCCTANAAFKKQSRMISCMRTSSSCRRCCFSIFRSSRF